MIYHSIKMGLRSISVFILFVLANFFSDVAGSELQCVLGPDNAGFNISNSDNPNGTIVDVNSETIPLKNNTPVYFIIHGFMSSPYTARWLSLAETLINELDVNVIAVDWRNGSCTLGGNALTQVLGYPNAVSNTRTIGEYVAEFMMKLISDFGVELEDILVVGHSLGAHIGAFAAKYLQANDIGTLSEIWALDPAGPGFTANDCETALCALDAKFLQTFHTSKTFGIFDEIGNTNFYFNGGGDQPNCPLLLPGAICSHSASVEYLIHIIREPECDYIGTVWNSSDTSTTELECSEDTCFKLGPTARQYPVNGSFYVNTTTLPAACVSYTSSTGSFE